MIWSLAPLEALSTTPLIAGLIIAFVGLLVGVVSAAFGIGGGFVITPLCHAVLGMPAPLAVATSMGQIPLLSASGVSRYWRAGVIDLRRAAWLLLGALPAAQLVAFWLAWQPERAWPIVALGQTLPDLLLISTFTLFIGGLGIYNLLAAKRTATSEALRQARMGPAGTLCCGVIFGGLSALLGIGGGFFAVPLFVYFCGLSPVQAVATSLFAVLVTSAVTTLHYLYLGQIYFAISLIVASGAILGAQIGARLALDSQPAGLLRGFAIAQILICVGYLGLKLF